MVTNMENMLRPHIYPCTSVGQYISDKKMLRSSTWGTDIEIVAFADLASVCVIVYRIRKMGEDALMLSSSRLVCE